MADLFTMRDAREDDRRYLDAYTYEEGMDRLPSLDGVRVAVNAQDEPVALIRISLDSKGVARVNPIVVHASWRGYGGELRLVSRGSSKAFYDAIGFAPCAWDLIEADVIEDCDGCPLFDECGPVPMRRVVLP